MSATTVVYRHYGRVRTTVMYGQIGFLCKHWQINYIRFYAHYKIRRRAVFKFYNKPRLFIFFELLTFFRQFITYVFELQLGMLSNYIVSSDFYELTMEERELTVTV